MGLGTYQEVCVVQLLPLLLLGTLERHALVLVCDTKRCTTLSAKMFAGATQVGRTIEVEVVDGHDVRLSLSTNDPDTVWLSTIAFLCLVTV